MMSGRPIRIRTFANLYTVFLPLPMRMMVLDSTSPWNKMEHCGLSERAFRFATTVAGIYPHRIIYQNPAGGRAFLVLLTL